MNSFIKIKMLFSILLLLISLDCFAQDAKRDTAAHYMPESRMMRSVTPTSWSTGNRFLYSAPALNVGIGTSQQQGRGRLTIDVGQINSSNGSYGRAIHAVGKVLDNNYLHASTETRLNDISRWNSQSQVKGMSSKVTLKRSSSISYDNCNSGGQFSTVLDAYTHNGSRKTEINGLMGRLLGSIAAHPSNSVIAAVHGKDAINNGKTWGGYFEGRGYFSSKVGIGNSQPTEALDVKGNIKSSGDMKTGTEGALVCAQTSGADITTGLSLYSGAHHAANYGIQFMKTTTATYGTYGNVTGDWAMYFNMSGTTSNISSRGWVFRDQVNKRTAASISGSGDLVLRGKLGVGNITPTVALDVNGTIKATEIKLKANGNTADFVFEEDYLLLDLIEVEKFIKENKHLPEIPSADDMEKEGINMAVMNKLLLQKIEELTLYCIDQNKQIELKKKEYNYLEQRLTEIESILEMNSTLSK